MCHFYLATSFAVSKMVVFLGQAFDCDIILVCRSGLFADAKVCEDVVEDVFGADFAGDGGEVVEGLA